MDGRQTTKEPQAGWSGDAPSLESLRKLRLMALLADVMDELGQVKAARKLGIDRKTLWRCRRSGKLTPRLSDALERLLLTQDLSAAALQGERVTRMERRIAELETELRTALEASEGRCEAAGEEWAKAIRQLERRLARLESAKGAEGATDTIHTEPQKPMSRPLRRIYRELVTEEAEPGEESVYGEATPVIVEWRRATAEYKRAVATGIALDRAEARMRVLELETELIDTHKLTLPPATYPWDGFDRREQLRLRELYMENARRNRRRALLRRFLTFGLWRK